MITEIENRLVRSISGANAFQHIENIAEFGTRYAGTEGSC